MNEINPGIFVGDQDTAKNRGLLESRGITHVLSLESEKPAVDVQFQHKFVCLYDEPERDFLEHLEGCFKFIEEGLKNGKVLIHCSVGVSRSSAIAVAFLMYRDKLTRDKALSIVKETRPYARPNAGFMEQLSLFEAMGCQLDTSDQRFKQHRLEHISYNMQGGGELPGEVLAADPQTSDTEKLQTIYRCKKCRRAVFLDSSILSHDVGMGQTSFMWHKQNRQQATPPCGATGSQALTCTSIFIEPVAWMESLLLGNPSGKLSCPKCDARMGSFNWAGQQCSCGSWVTPAFQIHQNRVDKCTHILPLQSPS